ncbi:MAG: cation:proton antiporter [Hyphomonas sp.]|uniref:Na+/H+ antiporter subunit E n=1 Tax=Hyphomonas sp. TaxID=87 RepID=UPI0018161E81|nr:Na+/H+ antiporter subunit E [Hyphomonas sp.]MBA3067718.1 cation:proton antiporter [Hyphomonas sp.]MBU3919155.1 Na+/H+ antiporter subunit E [Alphaproteobacteria bacterium]MBU4062195.1 Na+/H+ antiporter subunit E [Alphaproteobacteria bacterium]MBU4165630.1 Na+/H+ antiporter subunit E [Alphaproteobacteria bacterium]
MAYLLGIFLAIVAFWMGNSGHYTPLMLGFAALSVVLTLVLSARLKIIDREGAPYVRLAGLAAYYPWLLLEIAKSNWVVIKACLRADLDISPALVKVKTTCKTDLAKVTFANSITLTPGTVTVEIEGDKLLVHGLYEANTVPEAFEEMDRRCARAADPAGSAA